MIGANINAYFKAAMGYPVERLVAVMQGKDNSIPQAAAMMALQIKKPMIDAAKGQQAAQQPPQPSVKQQMEQEVSMLPENVGIMNVPAPNMEQVGMASGGIVAFAGGGSLTPEEQAELDRRRREYWGGLLPAAKERISRWWENIQQVPWESPSPMIKYATPTRTGIMNYEQPREALERMRKEGADTGGGGYKGQDFGAAGALNPDIGVGAAPTPWVDARAAATPPAAPKAPAAGAAPAGKKAPAAGITALPGAAPASTFTPGKEGDLGAELAKIKQYMPDAKAEYEGLGKAVEERYRELGAERERTKPQGKAMEGLEKLLTKEEAEGKAKEGKNLQMALINAGLAIAGGKSQYALQNIAEGAQVGTKQYMAGLEKLEEAAKERRRQAAAIEEARRAEERGDWKEAMQFKKEAADAALGIKKSQVEATMKITGESVKVAQDIVNNQNQIAARDRQIQEQLRVELEKQRMSDDAALQRSKVMASAYGGAKDPINIATDNAKAELEAWSKTPAGKLASMDPKQYEAKKREIYERVFKMSGLPSPFGGAAVTAPGGVQGKFLGFE